MEQDVVQDGGVLVVCEVDVFEDHFAVQFAFGEVGALCEGFAFLFDDFGDAPEGDDRFGPLHDQPSEVPHRPDDPDQHPGVRQIIPDGDGAVDGHQCPGRKAPEHLRPRDDVGGGPIGGVHHQEFDSAPKFFFVFDFKFVYLELLAGKGFDDPHPAQVFLQGGGEFRFLFLIFPVGFFDLFEEPDRNEEDRREDDDGDERQFYVDEGDGDEVNEEEKQNTPDIQGLLEEEALDGVHIGGGALEQFARLGAVVVAEGEPLDVVEQVVPQAEGDAFGGLRGEPSGEEGGPAFEEGKPDEPQPDPGEQVELSVAKYVVNQVCDEDEGSGFHAGGDARAGGGGKVTGTVAAHHPPHADEAVFMDGVFEIKLGGLGVVMIAVGHAVFHL